MRRRRALDRPAAAAGRLTRTPPPPRRTSDFERFSSVVKLRGFAPFSSAADALAQNPVAVDLAKMDRQGAILGDKTKLII